MRTDGHRHLSRIGARVTVPGLPGAWTGARGQHGCASVQGIDCAARQSSWRGRSNRSSSRARESPLQLNFRSPLCWGTPAVDKERGTGPRERTFPDVPPWFGRFAHPGIVPASLPSGHFPHLHWQQRRRGETKPAEGRGGQVSLRPPRVGLRGDVPCPLGEECHRVSWPDTRPQLPAIETPGGSHRHQFGWENVAPPLTKPLICSHKTVITSRDANEINHD